MQTYGFTVQVLKIPDGDLDRWSNLLWKTGCDDSSPGIFCGRPFVHFDREARSLDAAIASAVEAVRSTGVMIERVVLADDELAAVTAAAAAGV